MLSSPRPCGVLLPLTGSLLPLLPCRQTVDLYPEVPQTNLPVVKQSRQALRKGVPALS